MKNIKQFLEDVSKRNANNMREVRNPLPKSLQRNQSNPSFPPNQAITNIWRSNSVEIICIDSDEDKSVTNETNFTINSKDDEDDDCMIIDPPRLEAKQSVTDQPEMKRMMLFTNSQKLRQLQESFKQKDIFAKKTFIFFMRTYQLSELRVSVFLKQIRAHAGVAFESIEEYFEKNRTLYELIQPSVTTIYFVGSEEVPESQVRSVLEKYQLNKDIIINRVIGSEYLVQSLKQNSATVDIERHYLYRAVNMPQIKDFANLVSEVISQQKSQETQIIPRTKSPSPLKLSASKSTINRAHSSGDEFSDSLDSLIEDFQSHDDRTRESQKEKKRNKLKSSSKYLWDFQFDEERKEVVDGRRVTEESKNNAKTITTTQMMFYSKCSSDMPKPSENAITQVNHEGGGLDGDCSDQDWREQDENYDDYYDEDEGDIDDEHFAKMFIKEITPQAGDIKEKKDDQFLVLANEEQKEEQDREGWGEKIIHPIDCETILSTRLRGLLDDGGGGGGSGNAVQKSEVYQKLKNPFGGQIIRDRYWDKRAHNFLCASGSVSENFNSVITDELEKLLRIYQREKDIGRQIAYRKAVAIIKALKEPLLKARDVEGIPGIGDKIKQKVREILATGVCQKAQNLTNNERNTVLNVLQGIWGIGPSKAQDLYEQGIKSVVSLRKQQHMLNRNQKIGLRYYEDFLERMPRSEAQSIVDMVVQGVRKLYGDDVDRFDLIACGSFRRGKDSCGDVDILICRRDGEESKPKRLMLNLIEELEGIDFLIDHLQLPRSNSHGAESYMGVCRLPGEKQKARRLDIKYYPKDLFGYALLYFTGSDYFNRSMRLFARKKGYSLSDHGLYPVTRMSKNEKIRSGLTIPCYTEEQVFAALNLEYKPPNQRSV